LPHHAIDLGEKMKGCRFARMTALCRRGEFLY